MKNLNILSLFIFLFISASAIIAQSNEQKVIITEGGKYVTCGHDHDGDAGCMVFVPDEPVIDPNIQASPAGPMGACTPRPYRQLVAYDDTLLAQGFTHQQIVDLVMKAHKRFANALDSSGITTQAGTTIVGIIPVKIPSYTNLSEVSSWATNPSDGKLDELYAIKNDSLDADHVIILTREGISATDKGVNLQVTKTASNWLTKYWQKNFGIVNIITFVPNLTSTFAHESGHGIGGGHEDDISTPAYAKAYVNSTKQVNDLMKGARVESWTHDRFSGPNSKIVKNGETITLCDDTLVQNNAKHISECLDQLWCATENHVTRVSLPTTTCGSGKLQAITNNADTFQWKVLSGDCSISGTGQEISYMAMSLSKIQVIAQKQGKWYWDTAVVEIPALQIFPQTMETCQGTNVVLPNGNNYIVTQDTTMEFMLNGQFCDSMVVLSLKALPTSASSITATIKPGETYTLPDGKVVDTSGTFISTLINSFGCDSVITTILTVTTATVDPKVTGISIYPNPTHDMLTIDGLLDHDIVILQDLVGREQSCSVEKNTLSLAHLPGGIYILAIQRGGDIVVMKVLKL